jgi:hypothetical protein
MASTSIRDEIGTLQYAAWLDEVIADFGDYTFTRRELDTIGVGLHTKAARNLHRIAKAEKWALADIYAMGLAAFHNTPVRGIGNTTLIVTAYCIAAANDKWDVLHWIGERGRTVRGAVSKAKKTRRAA